MASHPKMLGSLLEMCFLVEDQKRQQGHLTKCRQLSPGLEKRVHGHRRRNLPGGHSSLHRLLRDGEGEGAVWHQWSREGWVSGESSLLLPRAPLLASDRYLAQQQFGEYLIRACGFSALHILVDNFEHGPFFLKFNQFYFCEMD